MQQVSPVYICCNAVAVLDLRDSGRELGTMVRSAAEGNSVARQVNGRSLLSEGLLARLLQFILGFWL